MQLNNGLDFSSFQKFKISLSLLITAVIIYSITAHGGDVHNLVSSYLNKYGCSILDSILSEIPSLLLLILTAFVLFSLILYSLGFILRLFDEFRQWEYDDRREYAEETKLSEYSNYPILDFEINDHFYNHRYLEFPRLWFRIRNLSKFEVSAKVTFSYVFIRPCEDHSFEAFRSKYKDSDYLRNNLHSPTIKQKEIEGKNMIIMEIKVKNDYYGGIAYWDLKPFGQFKGNGFKVINEITELMDENEIIRIKISCKEVRYRDLDGKAVSRKNLLPKDQIHVYNRKIKKWYPEPSGRF